MAEYANREHYIPIRKTDLIEMLCRDKQMPREDIPAFKQFCTLTSAVFHFEYLEHLERLKDLYALLNPDSQTREILDSSKVDRHGQMHKLFEEFSLLMEKANFKKLTKDDIQAAVDGGSSDWGINMYVNFEIFDELHVFVRGEGKSKRTKRHWLWFWKKTEKEVETYQRLALAVKLKKHKTLPDFIDTEDVFFKMFKDVPKLDIEMVLPGTSIQMPRSTKGKLGASLFGTIGYFFWQAGEAIWIALKTLFTGAASVGAVAGQMLMGPFIVLGGYGYKQWYSYQITKQTYAKQLTESLYFQTLDNNEGVMTHILDEAEEQECREAILAYYCLLRFAPPQGWNSEQLDDYVEMYLEGAAKLKVDFEIGDALDKVLRLGVVEKVNGMFKAVPLATALEKLDYRWDNYFQYNKA